MTRTVLTATAAAMLVACVDDGGAPEGAQLLVPDEVGVYWDDGFDGTDDGVGSLVPVDLMVYEGLTGEPLEAIDLDLAASTDDLTLIASDALEVVGSDCRECVWDATRDRYLAWNAESAATRTDSDGLARIYVWVDHFPAGEPLYFEVGMGDFTAQVDVYAD
jgi:hypothetical protein